MLKNIKKRINDQRGLTLIELLAVIVILGIVAAIAIPSIGGIIQNSKEDAVESDALQVLNAAKLYVTSHQIPDGEITLSKTSKEDAGGLDEYIDFNGDTYSITITEDAGVIEYEEIKASKGDISREYATEATLLAGTPTEEE